MYRVRRRDGNVSIFDWQDRLIYSADKESIILYRPDGDSLSTAKVDELTDEQLLRALAQGVSLNVGGDQ